MEFKNKLKIRLYTALIIGILGIFMIAVGASSSGLCFTVIGIARILQYKRITKNEETLHKREIAETDERNVMLWTKARNLTFSIYIILCAVAIIILNLLNMSIYAEILAYNIMAFVVIYWISYYFISRKN